MLEVRGLEKRRLWGPGMTTSQGRNCPRMKAMLVLSAGRGPRCSLCKPVHPFDPCTSGTCRAPVLLMDPGHVMDQRGQRWSEIAFDSNCAFQASTRCRVLSGVRTTFRQIGERFHVEGPEWKPSWDVPAPSLASHHPEASAPPWFLKGACVRS